MELSAAKRIHEGIESTELAGLKADLYVAAIRYAHIRAEWFLAGLEARKEMDLRRSLAHNALIDACNILSRNAAKAGEDLEWRAALTTDRREIGDFACHLHAIFGVLAR